jgi:hypothetical protein
MSEAHEATCVSARTVSGMSARRHVSGTCVHLRSASGFDCQVKSLDEVAARRGSCGEAVVG